MSSFSANLRALRRAFGETQEQLAEKTNFSKSAIGMYETSQRVPALSDISRFAQHFMISEGHLVSSDFSGLKPYKLDIGSWLENIGTVFPIITSEAALQCEPFRRAYEAHKSLYEQYGSESAPNTESVLFACAEDYEKAYDHDQAHDEAGANMLALFYLLMFEYRSTLLLCQNEVEPVLLDRVLSQLSVSPEEYSKYKAEILQDAKEQVEMLSCKENKAFIADIKKELKQSPVQHDLADYYLALPYYWNLEGNDWDLITNAVISVEMMRSISAVGNEFAKAFLVFLGKQIE